MKKSRLFSFLASAALAVASLGAAGFGASAAEKTVEGTATHSVTINKPANDQLDHTYAAYQIFKGTLTGEDNDTAVMTYISWGDGIDKSKLADAVAGNTTVSDALTAYNTGKPASDQLTTPFSADADAVKFANFISANASSAGFAEEIAKMFNNALTTVTGKYTTSDSEFTGLLTGYYLFKDADDSLQPKTVDGKETDQGAYTNYILKPVFLEVTENEVLNVAAKSDVPTIDKNIVDNNTDKKATTAAIGDVINYRLDTFIPDMTGYNKYFFIVKDTMCKGLTYNTTPGVAIKIDGTAIAADQYTATTETAENGETTLKIVFKNFIQYKGNEYKYTLDNTNGTYYKLAVGGYTNIEPTEATAANYATPLTNKYAKSNKPIQITYSATLNKDCDLTTKGNENTVGLTFSNNPNTTYSGKPDSPDEPKDDEPTGKTPEVQTKVYTTGIRVIKVDENGEMVTGATFRLYGEKLNKVVAVSGTKFTENEEGTYYELKDGSFTTTVPTTETAASYKDTTKKYVMGTFARTEQASATDETSGKKYVEADVDSDGYLVFNGLNAGTYTLVETEAPAGYNKDTTEYTFVIGNAEGKPTLTDPGWTLGGSAVTPTNGNGWTVATQEVTNKKGIILPATGGIGTVIFYVVGSLLIGAAGVLFVTKRKKTEK